MSSKARGLALGAAALAWGLASACPAWAHAGHKHSPSPSPGATPQASAAPGGEASVTKPAAAPEASPTPEPLIEVPLRDAVFEHLHNKVIHFPLALGCTAALFLLISYRWPQYWPAARLLLFLAATAAVAAYFTGHAQEEDVENGPLRVYFRRHETLGTMSAVGLWLGWALTFLPAARRWLWLYALLILALLSGTGFLGGILSHAAI